MAAGEADHPAVARGIDHLTATQRDDGDWAELPYNAVGFPRVFYLRYHGYRWYFPLLALARYRNLRRGNDASGWRLGSEPRSWLLGAGVRCGWAWPADGARLSPRRLREWTVADRRRKPVAGAEAGIGGGHADRRSAPMALAPDQLRPGGRARSRHCGPAR